jgi:hypothetical protein
MSQRRALPRLLPLLAALALTAGLAADDDQAPASDLFVDHVTVEVVNVDVTVTDRDGRPITGLSADDFVVLENGEERPISNFFAFRSGEMRLLDEAPAADFPEPVMRRRMALLFDNNSLEKRDRARAIDELERFVLERFDGTYEWAATCRSRYGAAAPPTPPTPRTSPSSAARTSGAAAAASTRTSST